jgi:riboflavin kinase/FMN adenylyltransferase
VSSTKIRKALLEGDMILANEYLGYEYFLTGLIVEGKQLGRTIGYPTANLKIEEDYKLIPKNGVYIVKSTINKKIVFGMMNIGFNPTVGGEKQTIEIHYFDFNEDLYDKKIAVSILHRIRSEQKFESITLLKEQLKKDASTANAYINKL